jgi:hypothetical protein
MTNFTKTIALAAAALAFVFVPAHASAASSSASITITVTVLDCVGKDADTPTCLRRKILAAMPTPAPGADASADIECESLLPLLIPLDTRSKNPSQQR